MVVRDSINITNSTCNVKLTVVDNYPETAPFMMTSEYDKDFIRSLVESALQKREYVYALFFNQTSTVCSIFVSKDNFDSFLNSVCYTFMQQQGYRYFYCADLFPLTEEFISDSKGLPVNLLKWTIDFVYEIYDDPVYQGRFSNFLEAFTCYRTEEIIRHLVAPMQGFINPRISADKYSYCMQEYCNKFGNISVGGYEEYLYSVNVKCSSRKSYQALYLIDYDNQSLDLWILYDRNAIG